MPKPFLKLEEAVNRVLESEEDDCDIILLGPPPGGNNSDIEEIDEDDVTNQGIHNDVSSKIEALCGFR